MFGSPKPSRRLPWADSQLTASRRKVRARELQRVSSPTCRLPPWPNTSRHSPRIARSALSAVRKAINENLPDE